MKLKRCLESKKIYILDDEGNKLLETSVIGAEFVLIIYTDKPIIITENLDKVLYKNLLSVFANKYIFDNSICSKDEKKILWVSDQNFDVDDKEQIEQVNMLIIEKEEKQIKIRAQNIFLQKLDIPIETFIIAFSPAGNGHYSKNIATGLTFQDDIIIAFNRILRNEFICYESSKKSENNMRKQSNIPLLSRNKKSKT